jgi:hypothetical protein
MTDRTQIRCRTDAPGDRQPRFHRGFSRFRRSLLNRIGGFQSAYWTLVQYRLATVGDDREAAGAGLSASRYVTTLAHSRLLQCLIRPRNVPASTRLRRNCAGPRCVPGAQSQVIRVRRCRPNRSRPVAHADRLLDVGLRDLRVRHAGRDRGVRVKVARANARRRLAGRHHDVRPVVTGRGRPEDGGNDECGGDRERSRPSHD